MSLFNGDNVYKINNLMGILEGDFIFVTGGMAGI